MHVLHPDIPRDLDDRARANGERLMRAMLAVQAAVDEQLYDLVSLTTDEGRSMTLGRVPAGQEIKDSRVFALSAGDLPQAIRQAGEAIHTALEERHRRTRVASRYLERVRWVSAGRPAPANPDKVKN